MRGLRPAIFLGRDGTINIDKDYLYRIEDCEYVDGAIDALRNLGQIGFLAGYYYEPAGNSPGLLY